MILAAAYEEYQRTRVDDLGFPKRLSEAEDAGDDFDVDAETINHAHAVLEQWKKENPEPPLGTQPRVIYHPTINPNTRG